MERKSEPIAVSVTDGGIRLSAVLERPLPGPGPLVIFLHGFTSGKDRPHNVASCEAMREAGFATLRMDLYGHGESGGEFRKHTLNHWVSNALAAVDWAENQDWVTEIWLSGHSQGGLTAALAAAKAPERIRGLILRAPAFMIPECARSGHMLSHPFDPAHIPDEVPVIKGLTLEKGYFLAAQSIHVEDAIDGFPGPVLLIHGDEDDTVPVEDSVKAAKRYRQATLEIIRGEGHHFDHHPAQMKAVIREWLARYRKPRVILLNGPSSSGKSTLSKALQMLVLDRMNRRYDVISIDDCMKVPPDETIYEDDVYEISGDMVQGALDALKTSAGVIIDHVITSERIYQGLEDALKPYAMVKVRVTCPLDILKQREKARGNRFPGSAESSSTYLFPKDGYDLTIDTGSMSSHDAAAVIFGLFLCDR